MLRNPVPKQGPTQPSRLRRDAEGTEILTRAKNAARRTFSSLNIRNYRLYFIGQAISLSGTWMQSIAQSWLVLHLTGSSTAIGLVIALQSVPVLFFGSWGGVLADRMPKRRILYITQASAGLLALVLGILVLTNTIQLWMLYVLAFLLGCNTALDNPTRQTFVLELVGKNQLTNAVTLNSTEINLARVVGPAMAGILIASVGLGWCFIINGLSYVAVLVVLAMMRSEDFYPMPLSRPQKGQLREGLLYVRNNPILLNTLLMMAIIGTLTYEFSVSLPVFARFSLAGDAKTYAAFNSAMGCGAVLGGIFAASRSGASPRALVRTAFFFGLSVLLVSMAPTVPMAIALLVLVGVFSITFTSYGNVTLQLECSPEMRGRVMALWAIAFLGSTPIGGPVIGAIAEHANPRWALAVGGFAAIAAAVLGLLTLVRPSGKPKLMNPQAAAAEMQTREEQAVK